MADTKVVKSCLIISMLGLLSILSCQGCQITEATPTYEPEEARISVKFSDGTDIRLRDGKLISLSSGKVPELDHLLDQYQVTNIERGFTQPEEEIEEERLQLIEDGNPDVPDLNLYFILIVKDEDTALKFIEALNQLDIVEIVELAPQPAPPPVENP